MKVLSFIELEKLKYSNYKKWYNYYKYLVKFSPFNDSETIDRYYVRFYSRPFRPELITELFKGWKRQGGLTSVSYRNNNSSIIITECVDEIKYYKEFPGTGEKLKCYIPRILDRFMCHCEDAGIELEWKCQK